MFSIHPDDEGFTYDSDAEIDRDDARLIGSRHEDRAWILSDRDVWYPNPFYRGPAVPHPEDYGYEDDDREVAAEDAQQPAAVVRATAADAFDDIPF